jgi:ribosomal-protein-alanine N-acetyltransferase
MKLETDRLALRSATPADAPLLQSLFSDPRVLRYLPPGPPFTLENAAAAIERRMKLERELGYAPWIVETKNNSTFIGSAGLLPVKDTTDVEIAYHLLPTAWGKGYASEAAGAVLGFGLQKLNLDEVVGIAFPENEASWRVLEKIGMQFEGRVRYHGIDGVKKYVARRTTWAAPPSKD